MPWQKERILWAVMMNKKAGGSPFASETRYGSCDTQFKDGNYCNCRKVVKVRAGEYRCKNCGRVDYYASWMEIIK